MTYEPFPHCLEQPNHGDKQNPSSPMLMSRKETADYLGVKEQTLACWATTKRYDLPYVKIGRLVKYKRDDVERFIVSNRFSGGGCNA